MNHLWHKPLILVLYILWTISSQVLRVFFERQFIKNKNQDNKRAQHSPQTTSTQRQEKEQRHNPELKGKYRKGQSHQPKTKTNRSSHVTPRTQYPVCNLEVFGIIWDDIPVSQVSYVHVDLLGGFNHNNSLLFLNGCFEECLENYNNGLDWLAKYSDVTGFDKLSRLRNLELMDLSLNMFNNSILSSLGAISSLKSLSLSDNRLKETVNMSGS